MPSIAKKRLPILSAKDLQSAINACLTPRDKALILFIADTGTRRAELCTLDWCDVDLETGLVRIDKGKGGKYRTVVIGVTTRRTLLSYRRTVPHQEGSPLFQAMSGKRLTHMGVRSALMRVGERADVKITPHALRRTFATLSLRAGMNLLELQAFLGHASLETTRRYVELLDEDLLNAHKDHGPIDVFVKNL